MGKRIGRWGLVNYAMHPTDKEYRVFNFNSKEEAELFEKELNKRSIIFERGEEEHENETLYLFAVKDRLFDKAQDANFMVSASTRKPMIPSRGWRYALLLFFFGIIAFAIIGYVKNS